MNAIDGLKRVFAGGRSNARSPWDPIDMQACLSRDHDVCEEYLDSGPESAARQDELAAEFLGTESRPIRRLVSYLMETK
jgi:hypothetical protein